MGALVSVSVVFIAVMTSHLSNPLLHPQKMNNSNNTITIMEALLMKDGAFDYLHCEVL